MAYKTKILLPTTISLINTFKCTSACKNCCFQCSPANVSRMSLDDMKKYIDECLKYYADSIKIVVITGGECMINRNDVFSILAYIQSLGLSSRIVTNAFWAVTYKDSYDVMSRLKDVGLKEINFSTGDEHQMFVPWRYVRNAAVSACRLGYEPIINVESHSESKFSINSVLKDAVVRGYVLKGQLHFEQGVWMGFEEGSINAPRGFVQNKRKRNLRCENLYRAITINPYGEVLACCGLTSEQNPFLRLGNIGKCDVKTIYESAFDDLLKIWLYVDGPHAILRYINEKRDEKSNIELGHLCDACRSIFKQEENLKLLRECHGEIAGRVILKYNLLSQRV